MSREALIALLPVIIISLGILVQMLQAAWRRDPELAQGVCLLTLLGAAIAQLYLYPQTNQPVTLLFEFTPASSFFTLLVLLCAFSVGLVQRAYAGKNSTEVSEEFYLLLLLATLGAMLLVMARHAAGMLLGLELMSLAILALLAYNRQRALSLEAAFKYLVLSAAATSLLLLGLALMYANSGQLQIEHMLSGPLSLLGKAGLVLLVAALAFKLSLVPLHVWTPDVYQGAPVNSTLLLASLSKTAVFALLFKLLLLVPADFADSLTRGLSWMAIASMLLGNWLALCQQSIKRLMAYSAIAHMGYVLVAGIIAIGADKTLIIEGASYYLLAYLVASILIFAVLGLLSRLDSFADVDELAQLNGLFWRHPWPALLMTLAFLSLAGMPITIGFIGKFYLLTLAVELRAWWLVFAMVIGSGVGLYYYLRVILSLYAKEQTDTSSHPSAYLTKTWLGLVAATLLLLGILPGLLGDQLTRLLTLS